MIFIKAYRPNAKAVFRLVKVILWVFGVFAVISLFITIMGIIYTVQTVPTAKSINEDLIAILLGFGLVGSCFVTPMIFFGFGLIQFFRTKRKSKTN